jgi:hypothetical protein
LTTINWRKPASGDFAVATNWKGGAVPGAADTAALDATGAAFVVTSVIDEAVGSLRLASNAYLGISGSTFSADSATGSVTNAGSIFVSSGGKLSLAGAVANSGTISLDTSGGSADLELQGSTTLTGAGSINLEGGPILAASGSDTLVNIDNTISGEGSLSGGSIVNAAGGVIDAYEMQIACGGGTLSNAGLLEAVGYHLRFDQGFLNIQSPVENSGTITCYRGSVTLQDGLVNDGLISAIEGTFSVDGAVSGAGTAMISHGTLFVGSSFDQSVAFKKGGVLELSVSQGYGGVVTGFSSTGETTLGLRDITFDGSTEATYSGTAKRGVLTVTDGTHTARIRLKGNYLGVTFTASYGGGVYAGTAIVATVAPAGAPVHLMVSAMAAVGVTPLNATHLAEAHLFRPTSLFAPRAAWA